MPTISAVFESAEAARAAMDALAGIGIEEGRINYLMPGNAAGEANPAAGLAKGTGATLGGILGMGASTFLIPGLGPIAGVGLIAGAIAGTALGAVVGKAVDRKTDVPREDLYFYEEALRRGQTIIIVNADHGDEETRVRNILEHSGGRSIDSIRREWWYSLRDREREYVRLRGQGDWNESDYQSGFEAALHPATRGQDYDQVAAYIESCYPGPCKTEVFRVGFDRGRQYLQGNVSGEVF
ncbi:MAG TPA: hypothetical protein VFM36_04690 [Thermoanaerobaculia bacterium]|nr:hypothetical protein [Thermoanaerobaculia bacterium]